MVSFSICEIVLVGLWPLNRNSNPGPIVWQENAPTMRNQGLFPNYFIRIIIIVITRQLWTAVSTIFLDFVNKPQSEFEKQQPIQLILTAIFLAISIFWHSTESWLHWDLFTPKLQWVWKCGFMAERFTKVASRAKFRLERADVIPNRAETAFHAYLCIFTPNKLCD